MADPRNGGRPPQAYVVLRETAANTWTLVGEVTRRPGLPARKGRAAAVADALGRPPADGERFAVLPRSEWRVGLDW